MQNYSLKACAGFIFGLCDFRRSYLRLGELLSCRMSDSKSLSRARLSNLSQHAGEVKEMFLGKFMKLRVPGGEILSQTQELMRVENSLPVRFNRKQSLYQEDRCIPDAARDGQDLVPAPGWV